LLVTCGMCVVFSTNKTDSHDITEILLKVALKHHNLIPIIFKHRKYFSSYELFSDLSSVKVYDVFVWPSSILILVLIISKYLTSSNFLWGLITMAEEYKSWLSVLLVEKTTHMPQVTNKLYHIMLYQAQLAWAGFELATFIMMGTDCIGSCKPKYHTITNTTAPLRV
jgi:predicted molibdopterin-dependent oxidoreductase YjgC